jgi:uncharacterized protein (TIGR00290 family)
LKRPSAEVALSWGGGKDSALALWKLRTHGHNVTSLITTVTEQFERVSMHGVRVELLEAQAAALELPLVQVRIPPECPNEVYEERMAVALGSPPLRDRVLAFGDLFLEDVRAYREQKLAAADRRGLWPIWGEDTTSLAETFIEAGFRAVVVCVDPRQLDASFCGREFDRRFLADLPDGVDPCGERGEFHTFVYDGPIFTRPIDIARGDVVERDGFVFGDLMAVALRS